MGRPLEGIRVLEVAQWWFVPAAGAVLADWGAEVVKIEHPVRGDAQALANGYLRPVASGDRGPFHVVASPVQFDEQLVDLEPSPDLGQHTEGGAARARPGLGRADPAQAEWSDPVIRRGRC